MAAAVHCWALPSKFSTRSLNNPSSAHLKPTAAFCSLTFSASISHNVFSSGFLSMSPVLRPNRLSIVCEATTLPKKTDSAVKRARQAEKRRLRNKSKKSEVRTRMKKVLEALDLLRRKKDAQQEEVLSIEKMISEAYKAIDKAVSAGVLHRNTGANRKSRLARRKKAIEIHHGWYTPAPANTV